MHGFPMAIKDLADTASAAQGLRYDFASVGKRVYRIVTFAPPKGPRCWQTMFRATTT